MMSTPYCYNPLDENAQQIRLLTLLPGSSSAQIKANLEIVRLSTEHVPDFEAISYAWGSTKEPVEVCIESKSGLHVLSVTQNLAEALYHLRYETEPRILWIDAICINQQDIPERNSQVKRMSDVYRLSRRVVVWLGRESTDSSRGLCLLRSLSAKIEVNWASETMKATSEDIPEQHWADVNEVIPYNVPELAALVGIFERPWFGRLWIWQEILLAGPSAMLVCGKETILWTTFRNAFFCTYFKPWPHGTVQNSVARLQLVRELCKMPKYRPFARLIEDTNYSKCMDPRDRVFALRSLLDPQDLAATIEPDYKKDVSEIYTELFLRYSEKAKRLGLMQRCELTRETSGIPTWLPNWAVPRMSEALTFMTASGSSAPVLDLIDRQRLRVCGIAVATLESIARQSIWQESAIGGMTFGHVTREIHKIARKFRISNTQLESFCDSLCGGLFAHHVYPEATAPPFYPNFLQSIQFVAKVIETTHFIESHMLPSERIFLNLAASMLRNRVAYKTSSGTFGIAPCSAEPGDVVVVILGCLSAIVLRPSDENTYKVVGESYCYGYKSCEGLLGPLPNTHRMVWFTINEHGNRQPLYLELASGILQVEDPRLGKLPRGWKLYDHDNKDIFNWFVNEETGEGTNRDPRLTPEVLKAGGVKVEYFDLI